MKRWKCILRGIILLTLTAALLGGGAGGMTMTAQAKEAPARGNEGVERLAEDEPWQGTSHRERKLPQLLR